MTVFRMVERRIENSSEETFQAPDQETVFRARPHRSPPVTTNSISRECLEIGRSLTCGHTLLILAIRSEAAETDIA